MIHAYDEIYLERARFVMANMFDYAVHVLESITRASKTARDFLRIFWFLIYAQGLKEARRL